MEENSFRKYFNDIIKNNSQKMYCCYLGIKRSDYPKWEGWKIINLYKKNGVHISNIQNDRLDTLVENFYYMKYLGL